MKLLRKLSLLFVSLLVVSSGVLLPSLPNIMRDYPQIPKTFVELLGTLPALFTILVIPYSPHLARKIGYKRVAQLGMIIVFTSGILPIFFKSFLLLFISRIIFGIGIGLFNPLLYRFSTNMYHDKELLSMLGFQSAFEGAGGIITSLLVAQLIYGGWRNTLWTYLMVIPILLLFSLFTVDIRPSSDYSSEKKKVEIDLKFLWLIFLLFILVTIYMSVSIKLSIHLYEQNYGTTKDASIGLACMGLGAMMAGFLFRINLKILNNWLLPITFVVWGLSMLFLSGTKNTYVMILMNFLIGFCFRTFIPFLLNLANRTKSDIGEKKTALLLVGFNIGSALAPISVQLLCSFLNIIKVSDLFLVEAILIWSIAILFIIKLLYKNVKYK